MRYVLDTNILLRLVLIDEPQHALVVRVAEQLEAEGHELCATAPSMRELRHVCTRSVAANGIGLSPQQTLQLVTAIRDRCSILTGSVKSFEDWVDLVSTNSITGAVCHDANHVAVAKANGVDCLLTFDTAHFKRFVSSGIPPVRPQDISP